MKLGKVARLFSKDKSKPSKVDELLESMPTLASKDIDTITSPTWITKKEAKEAKKNFQQDVDKSFKKQELKTLMTFYYLQSLMILF